MGKVKISELPSTTVVGDNDLIQIVQQNTNKKISLSALQEGIVTPESVGNAGAELTENKTSEISLEPSTTKYPNERAVAVYVENYVENNVPVQGSIIGGADGFHAEIIDKNLIIPQATEAKYGVVSKEFVRTVDNLIKASKGIIYTDEDDETSAYVKNIASGTQKYGLLNYIGGKTVSNRRLPAEYQEIEYLENSGDAYINTLFKPNNNTSAEIKFQCLESAGSGSGVFGARINASEAAYTFILGSDNKYAFSFGSNNPTISKSWDRNIHTIRREKNKVYLDETLIVTNTDNTFASTYNALLFTYNNNGAHSVAKHYKIWYCKIWDNGVLVRDMIPCYQVSNSTLGMYDIVNNVFYGKQGSGSFSKGADVEYPLISGKCDKVISKNSSEEIISTYEIPEAVQSLDGYGWSAGNVYNYVDFDEKKFHKRVSRVDLGSLNWTLSSAKNIFYSSGIASRVKNVPVSGAANAILQGYTLTTAVSQYDNPQNYTLSIGGYFVSKAVNICNFNYTSTAAFKAAMNGVYLYYELAEEEVIDISTLFADDNAIEVEAGGTLEFHQQDDAQLDIPSKQTYMVKVGDAL